MNTKQPQTSESTPPNPSIMQRSDVSLFKQTVNKSRQPAQWLWLLVLSICLGFIPKVNAALRTWSGGGSDNSWGTAANWGGSVPINGDDLVFDGSTRLNNTNSIVPLRINSLAYNTSGFTNYGQGLMITNGIVDIAGGNTNIVPITLGGSQSISNQSALTLLLSGTIAMSNYNLTVSSSGGGNLFLNGVISGNGLVGVNSLNVYDGTVRLAGANTFNGDVNINSGTLMLANAAAIPSGAGRGDMRITSGAVLNLNGNSQQINGLIGDGTVDNLTGAASLTLTVGNNATNTGGAFYFGGTIQNTSGKIGLTKVNTNIFLIGGSSAYTGSTIVSGGALVLTNGATLASSSDFTVSPGATFNITNGPFSMSGTQVLTAGRTTNGGPADIIGDPNSSGTIHIYKAGQPGTLRLSDGLTLNGGLVNFDLGNNTVTGGTSNDVIALNGLLTLGGLTTVRLNPVVGSFAIGNYTLITNSSASLSGSAANLAVETPRGITATLDTTTFPGSVLVGISGSSTPVSLIWSGVNSGDWDVNVTQNWLSNGVADVFYNLDNVVFNDTTVNANVNVATGVSPFTTVINNSSSNYVFSGAGSIAGSGSLTKSGTAQATLRNTSSFLGNTIISGGTLFFDFLNSGATISQIFYNSVAAGSLVMNGGTLLVGNRGNTTTYQQFGATTLNSGGAVIQQNTRLSGGSPAVYLGAITRNTGGTADINPNVGSGSSQTVTTVGVFTTTANNNATTSGILGGYATYAGGTEFARLNTSAGAQGGFHIYGGSIYLNSFASTTNTDMTADLVAASGTNTATVRFNTASARTLTLTGTNVITSGGVLVTTVVGANQSTITGGTALTSGNGQDLIVHQYDLTGNLVINSVVSDNGATSIALTKAGGGTLILGTNNTYTSPTFINAGTLQIGNNGIVGGIDTSSGVTNRGTLAFKRTDAVTFALPISGSGALTQLGAGTVTLTGNNTYSGVTTISAGTLQVGNGGIVGSLGTSPSITDNGSLIFNRSDNILFTGPITGSGLLTKLGAGSLTLKGTNTYVGATLVNVGSIVLGASATLSNSAAIVLAGSTTLDVSAQGNLTLFGGTVNQILAGTGTVKGSVTTSSGTGAGTRITPGTNGVVGTLTITNALTLSGGTLSLDVSSGAKDLIVVGGALTLNSGTIALNVSGSLPNGSYKLIGYTGALNGSVANLVVNGFSQGGSVASLSSATAGEINLVISSYVPINLTWQGDGAGNPWDVLTTPDWTNSIGVAAQFNQNDNAKFDDTSANTTVNLQTVLTPNTVTVNGSVNSYILQGVGSIAGGTLTVNNPNTLTILTTNTYSGLTTINAGTVALGNPTTAGSFGSGAVANNGAIIFNEPSDTIAGNAISGSGSLTHSAANVLSLIGNSTMTGPVTISSGTLQVGVGGGSGSLGTSAVTDDGTLQISRSGSLTIGGNITGTGTLIVDGSGTVTLSGANSYANNTYISNGVVKLGGASAIPSGGATTGWLVLDGGASTAGTLDLNGLNQTINALSGLTGGSLGKIVNDGGSGTNTLTIDEIVSTTFAGNILDKTGVTGGKVAIVKNGPNTLTLTSDGTGSSFSGGTLINDGIVSGGTSTTANSTMLGTGPVIFGTNGTLQLAGWAGSTTPGYSTCPNPIVVLSNYTATILGCCRVGGPFPSFVTGGTNSTLIYVSRYVRGQLGGNWDGFFGTLVATNIPASGGVSFPVNHASGFPNARVILAPNEGMMSFAAGTPNIPIGELTGDASSSISLNADNSGGQAVRWAVGGLNTTAQFDGSIGGAHGIVKVGTGTWTLTGATLNYTGLTTVSNGVLALGASANLTGSTPITLAAPGKLDVSASGTLTLAAQTIQGNGTLLGSLSTGAGTTVSPGGVNNLANLTVTNTVTLAGTTIMELNRTNSPATNDMLTAASVSVGGTLQVNNLGPDLHTGDSFKLFSVPVTGAFAITNLPVTTGNGLITYVWTNKLDIDGTIGVLVGAPNVNTTPTNITSSVSGDTLTLSWPADHIGWKLQVQTNSISTGLASNWFDVAGSTTVSTMNFTINPANGSVFYRMVLP